MAANETEVAKLQDTTTVSSSSEKSQSSNKTQTSTGVKTNASAHWEGIIYKGLMVPKPEWGGFFCNYYKAWFYIKSEVVMLKMSGRAITT